MTDRTPSQVNESLDNAWALIRELQDAQRAIARTSDDLCLRVSQNHERVEKELSERIGEIDARRIARDEGHATRCDLGSLTHRVRELEPKAEQIDTVLSNLCMQYADIHKRVADLELAAQIRSKVIEPSVEVIIRDQTTSIDEIKRACLMLGATRVVVDAGGVGSALLRYLQADGLPAVAMAKPEKAWWKS